MGVFQGLLDPIDLLYWLFGKPAKVAAIGGKLSNLQFDVEDTVSILMEQFEGTHFFPVSINMSFVQKTPLRDLMILGEFGSLKWDILKNDSWNKKMERGTQL